MRDGAHGGSHDDGGRERAPQRHYMHSHYAGSTMRYSRGSYATGRMTPVGLVLVLVLVLVGAQAEAKAGQVERLRLARLGVLEEAEAEQEQEDRGSGSGSGDGDWRMGRPLETLGRGGRRGTAADLEHCSPDRAGEFLDPTERPLDVPRMDGKVGG